MYRLAATLNCIAKETKLKQVRLFSGFSFFCPRKLDQIVKIDLLKNESRDKILDIWKEYHKDKRDVLCGDMQITPRETMKIRIKSSPLMILPVMKSLDSYFILLSQVQENAFMITYLDEYKHDPISAKPWISVTFFDEFIDEKRLCLYRL
jgi:hypothetical protein